MTVPWRNKYMDELDTNNGWLEKILSFNFKNVFMPFGHHSCN